MTPLVLNQYRHGSSYKDVVGTTYHFPKRYRKSFLELPSPFVYYEPREGGAQVYFGAGYVSSVCEDTEDVDHSYAEIARYQEFAHPVDFYSGPDGATWENAKKMRNSVRKIELEMFRQIVATGGIEWDAEVPRDAGETQVEALRRELGSYAGNHSAPILRRVRRILESYERPSGVTNQVKRSRGDSCQLCGTRGFLKRDGNRYCEVHHLFHLADDPPRESLAPEYLVVLCATCHRRMHYAEVSRPEPVSQGWRVVIDGAEFVFGTRHSE